MAVRAEAIAAEGSRRGRSDVVTPSHSAAVLQRTFPARPESVAAVRAAIAGYARTHGVPECNIGLVSLATSEAATNVVMHAYTGRGDAGDIEVVASRSGAELSVVVADTGTGLSTGLRPRRDSPGLALGLPIIARVADAIDLAEPASGGLEVRMRFALEETGFHDRADPRHNGRPLDAYGRM
jgi:sigma-B regulation protein RsbU (phosphoserine phosphatase)